MACERLGLIVVHIPAAFPLQKQLGGSRDGAARACGYARIVPTGAIRKAVIDKKRQAGPCGAAAAALRIVGCVVGK